MIAIASLVERSAELKRELLEFSWQPRFDRDRREVLRDHFPNGFVGDESELITALDYFLLQHELRSGKTVVERFAASRPDLPGTSASCCWAGGTLSRAYSKCGPATATRSSRRTLSMS